MRGGQVRAISRGVLLMVLLLPKDHRSTADTWPGGLTEVWWSSSVASASMVAMASTVKPVVVKGMMMLDLVVVGSTSPNGRPNSDGHGALPVATAARQHQIASGHV
jgi:hypothetical protein